MCDTRGPSAKALQAERRKQYMATLALTAQNEATNLKANQWAKLYGVQPPAELADTRTLAEVLADTERLKVDLRSALRPLMGGQERLEVTSALSPQELEFAVQMAPYYVPELQRQYSRGMPALAYLSYLKALIRKQQQTNGVSFESQEATSRGILNALEAGRAAGAVQPAFAPQPPPAPPAPPARQPPQQQAPSIRPGLDLSGLSGVVLRPSREPAPQPVSSAPASSNPFLAELTAAISRRSEEQPAAPARPARPPSLMTPEPETQPVRRTLLDELTERVSRRRAEPTDVGELERQLEERRATARPPKTALLEEFEELAEARTPKNSAEEVFERWLDKIPTEAAFLKTKWALVKEWFAQAMSFDGNLSAFAPRQYQRRDGQLVERPREVGSVEDAKQQLLPAYRVWVQRGQSRSEFWNMKEEAKEAAPTKGVGMRGRGKPKGGLDFGRFPSVSLGSGVRGAPRGQEFNPSRVQRTHTRPPPLQRNKRVRFGVEMPFQGGTIQGRGLGGRQQTSSGARERQYVPLGKWAVNYPKLTQGRLEMRTHTGGRVAKYNKERELHPRLARVLRGLLSEPERGVDASEFRDLEPSDQEFMARLLTDSCVQDRVALPEVELSQDSQDLQRFEVLKGQIGAGNDSRELVAEFKTLLVRFVKKGWVAKAAAADVLAELVDAGY
jgi:hypothetical protein